ncbi:glycosyltransferase family 2 protein [Acidovorax sp.]|uniref:glycosyltransferase family 2 protein n=1 Tax=Acidovorax sp. TaxID=1872122 RepID=UPI0026102A4E|nr:glycosyltransferase family 2 protein [Acidovorax sp.]
MSEYKIFCIVVTYCPDIKHLKLALASIAQQTSNIIQVDNTPISKKTTPSPENIQHIALGKNIGIAAAQNIGIRKALEQEADVIWLSDQDTIYPTNFLVDMLAALHSCQAQGTKLGAIAPTYFDTNKGALQAFVRHSPFTQFFTPQPGLHHVSHAIASGTLIISSALREIGLMQESLFIDWVDLEWCWRAKKQYGYHTICTGDVVIEHTMGDGSVQFLGKKVSIRSPLRHYYMVRNAVHIALYSRAATVPIRLEIFSKALAWTLIFPQIAPSEKRKHLRATLTGLWDGLCNRMGQKTLA